MINIKIYQYLFWIMLVFLILSTSKFITTKKSDKQLIEDLTETVYQLREWNEALELEKHYSDSIEKELSKYKKIDKEKIYEEINKQYQGKFDSIIANDVISDFLLFTENSNSSKR